LFGKDGDVQRRAAMAITGIQIGFIEPAIKD
jgi:hypothetical protein